MSLKARIAPTPSGFLHEGNILAFLIQDRLAIRHGAILGLRIDDLDRERYREEYLQDIFRWLSRIGVQPEFGPRDADDFHKNHRQALRLERYMQVLDQLKAERLVYACRCSRKELDASGGKKCPAGCSSQKIPLDEPGVLWRLRWPTASQVEWSDGFQGKVRIEVTRSMGDVVLRRRDGLPSYQITSLTDDHDMGIGLLVRGQDLLDSTALQIWLHDRLWEPKDMARYHHMLVSGPDGVKLSKSAGFGSFPLDLDEYQLSGLRQLAKRIVGE
jgi:glutamyl-tRNA synthetase